VYLNIVVAIIKIMKMNFENTDEIGLRNSYA